jgi:hypothetical protein
MKQKATHTGKFLGDTKGNRDLPNNRTTSGVDSCCAGAAGGHLSGKFAGGTKGNRDLPPNRSTGVVQGAYTK